MSHRSPITLAPRVALNETRRRLLRLSTALHLFAAIALAGLASSAQSAMAAALEITTTTLPTGYDGSAYSTTFAATGGTGTGYSWSIATGKLPAGLTLTAATGTIAGKPTAAGVSSLTVKVTDSAKNTASANLSIDVEGALAVLTSPAPGSTLTGPSETFEWLAGTGATEYDLHLGSTGVGSDNLYISGHIAATSKTVTGLPTNGQTIYARMYSLVSGTWEYIDYTYKAGSLATLTSPTPGSTLAGASATFKWSAVTGATNYMLAVGNTGPGSGDLYQGTTTALDATVTGLPLYGETIYARIFTQVNGSWEHLDYTYTEALQSYLYSPAPESHLTGPNATFYWSQGVGVTDYDLHLGTTGVGSDNLYISGHTTATSKAVTGLPTNGQTVYARIYSLMEGTWEYYDYTYTATSLAITSGGILPVGYLDSTYSDTLTASGGSDAGYKFTATNKLPQGLTLTSAGVLSGAPAVLGTSTIDVKVTDSAGNTATAALTLRVNPIVSTCTNDHPATAFVELMGVYTFQFNRISLVDNNRSWSVGSFHADGLGNILNGVMDTNGPEYPGEVQSTFTGTYTVGSDGRGRMDVQMAGSQETNTFCFALDTISLGTAKETAAHAVVMEDDTTNNAVSGEFYHQVATPSLLAVKGSWVVGLAGRTHNIVANEPDFRDTIAGYFTLDGSGNLTAGEVDQNKDVMVGGVLENRYKQEVPITGTYTMPTPATGTPTGRGILHVAGPGGNTQNFVFYPAGPDYFAMLETDAGDPASGLISQVLVGGAFTRTQTVFTLATGLIGSSVRSQYFLTNVGEASESSGVGLNVTQWDGKGNFTYTGDMNAEGVASTTSGPGTYTVDAKGRFEVLEGGLCSPCGYITKSDAGVAIYDSTDGGLEILEYQDVPIGGPFEIAGLQGAYSVGNRWFIFPEQQTLSGELVSNGAGTFTGTLDQNLEGDTVVNLADTETETSTSTSGGNGRFLLYNNEGGATSALYFVNKNEALSIQLNADNGQTQTLNQYYHQ
jgi:hypothetical protein